MNANGLLSEQKRVKSPEDLEYLHEFKQKRNILVVWLFLHIQGIKGC